MTFINRKFLCACEGCCVVMRANRGICSAVLDLDFWLNCDLLIKATSHMSLLGVLGSDVYYRALAWIVSTRDKMNLS